MKYSYPRTDISVRVSADLHKQLRYMATDLGITLQDVSVFALLQTCDAGVSCDDWNTLPAVLKKPADFAEKNKVNDLR